METLQLSNAAIAPGVEAKRIPVAFEQGLNTLTVMF
jgi:hypothetical protein